MLFKHNDFEIISLGREGNNEALELLFEKYSPLIYKKIFHFNLQREKDDMYQEGLMVLHQSLLKYDETFNKTFTKYFEMNLERKYISIVSKQARRYQIFNQHVNFIYENNHADYQESIYFQLYKEEISKILTKTENLVYTLRELQNYSIHYIKDKYGLTEKNIYNSLYRAKQKILTHFSN